MAIHFLQFAGVLLALGGFLVLYRLLQIRGEVPLLARWALGATVATAAVWAVLHGVDGVTLKQNVDARADASGAVGHSGLDKPGGPFIALQLLIFAVGVLVAGVRTSDGSEKAGGR